MTRALYHARELAMNRMEEEADALGADGIVGVRLDREPRAANPIRSRVDRSTASGRSGREARRLPERSSTTSGRSGRAGRGSPPRSGAR